MSFPDIKDALNLLGYRMRDKISGLTGVVTSVCFDLYGCVQAILNTGVDKDGKLCEHYWFDVQRLELVDEKRVMEPPAFGQAKVAEHQSGPERKPAPSWSSMSRRASLVGAAS